MPISPPPEFYSAARRRATANWVGTAAGDVRSAVTRLIFGFSCPYAVKPESIAWNLETDSRAVVRFYNRRGTAKQWIKEGKQAVKMTRLSCHRLRCNEMRLWLSVMAYNLGSLWRRLVLPKRIDNWSLTS